MIHYLVILLLIILVIFYLFFNSNKKYINQETNEPFQSSKKCGDRFDPVDKNSQNGQGFIQDPCPSSCPMYIEGMEPPSATCGKGLIALH